MRKRYSYLFLLIFVIIIGTIIVGYYQQRNSQQSSLLNLPKLEVGDWVVRMGTVNDSWWISYLSNSEYSHIGMIVATEPKILVIHATTDDGEIGSDQVIVSELDRFLSPALAKKGAIIRPIFLDSKKKKEIVSAIWKQRGKPFILASKDKYHLYCTTLLLDSIQHFHPSFQPQWTKINIPLFEGEYLFPQSFVDYPNTRIIYHLNNY